MLSNFELLADSPYVWLFSKNVPAITRINMDTPHFILKYHFPAANFTRIVKPEQIHLYSGVLIPVYIARTRYLSKQS